MNQLQGISPQRYGNVFVTLNPPPTLEPKADTVVKDGVLEHPIFTADVSLPYTPFLFQKPPS